MDRVEKQKKIWANETLCGMPVPELVGILRAAGFTPAEITARTGVPRGSLYRIAPSEKEPVPAPSVEEKEEKSFHSAHRENGVCPKCGAAKPDVSAPFCWKCGADIRNPTIMLTELLEDALGDLTSFPNSKNDKAIKAINKTIDYFSRERSSDNGQHGTL